MNILRESIRALLKEISIKEASASLRNSALKMMSSWYYMNELDQNGEKFGRDVEALTYEIRNLVPEDIEDNQRALALIWAARVIKKDLAKEAPANTILKKILYSPQASYGPSFAKKIELFFQWQQFMSVKDLNKIESFDSLIEIVDNALPAINKHKESKLYLDAPAGTEILRNDEKFEISIAHNKGAACQLGKGTEWCTAAPGLDYFEKYYQKDDPLFIFTDKNTGERFQFHFGSRQFKDVKDNEIQNDKKDELVLALASTEAIRYRSVTEYVKIILESPEDDYLPYLDDKVFKNIVNKGSEDLKDIALKHKSFPAEMQIEILRNLDLKSSGALYTVSLLSSNPSFPKNILRKILSIDEDTISPSIAEKLKKTLWLKIIYYFLLTDFENLTESDLMLVLSRKSKIITDSDLSFVMYKVVMSNDILPEQWYVQQFLKITKDKTREAMISLFPVEEREILLKNHPEKEKLLANAKNYEY